MKLLTVPSAPTSVWLALVSATIVTVSFAANSAPVSPINCASGTVFDFKLDSEVDLWRQPRCPDSPNCPQYVDQLNGSWYFVGNKYQSKVEFYTDYIDTEWNYDFLRTGYLVGGSEFEQFARSGWYNSGYNVHTSAPGTSSLQANIGFINFRSDYSQTARGFRISSAKLTCGASNDNVFQGRTFFRHTGVLQGDGDAVNIAFPAGSGHQTVALWGPTPTAPVDFDVFVRCGSRPTGALDADYSGTRSSGSPEFLHIPEGMCASTWYVLIHSWSGSGQFNLVWSRHKSAQHKDINFGIKTPLTVDTRSLLESRAQVATRRLFGWTEGQVFIEKIHTYTSDTLSETSCACPGGVCEMNYFPVNKRPYSGLCDSCARVFVAGYSTHGTMAHELSHRLLCLEDEYVEELLPDGALSSSLAQCGHTAMGRFPDPAGFCTITSHNASPYCPPSGPCIGPSSLPAGWQVLLDSGVAYTNFALDTPDMYDYVNFDFAGNLGQIVAH